MKPSELPGARSFYRLTNRALAQIKELWQYAGEDELPPESLLHAQVEALRILHIDRDSHRQRVNPRFCCLSLNNLLGRYSFAIPEAVVRLEASCARCTIRLQTTLNCLFCSGLPIAPQGSGLDLGTIQIDARSLLATF